MTNKPKQVQVKIENEFATTDKNSDELQITMYERAFRKLTQENDGIGKLFPIYIKIDNSYFVLGIYALNKSGSTSFFPELPQSFFDHITLGRYLNKNTAHLTHLAGNKHKKTSSLAIDHLTNDTYHFMTLIFQDLKLV